VYLAKRRDGIGGYVVMKRVFVVEENSKEHQQAQNEVKMLQVPDSNLLSDDKNR
jgi:hypothetical protein